MTLRQELNELMTCFIASSSRRVKLSIDSGKENVPLVKIKPLLVVM